MTPMTAIPVAPQNSTTIKEISKQSNTACHGFVDVNGVWNNGFDCPIENFVQYICCRTNSHYYCCSPDFSGSEINFHQGQTYISGPYQPIDQAIVDRNYAAALVNSSIIVNRQFEHFQTLFLPIFLVTSSVLLLVGIAIWFWLYKHKAFYAIGQENLNEKNQTTKTLSESTRNNPRSSRSNSINLTMEQSSRRFSRISTEV